MVKFGFPAGSGGFAGDNGYTQTAASFSCNSQFTSSGFQFFLFLLDLSRNMRRAICARWLGFRPDKKSDLNGAREVFAG